MANPINLKDSDSRLKKSYKSGAFSGNTFVPDSLA